MSFRKWLQGLALGLALTFSVGQVAAQLRSPEAVEADIAILRPLGQLARGRLRGLAWGSGQGGLHGGTGESFLREILFPQVTSRSTIRSQSPAPSFMKRSTVTARMRSSSRKMSGSWTIRATGPADRRKGSTVKNFQTKDKYYVAYSPDGKQVYPAPR